MGKAPLVYCSQARTGGIQHKRAFFMQSFRCETTWKKRVLIQPPSKCKKTHTQSSPAIPHWPFLREIRSKVRKGPVQCFRKWAVVVMYRAVSRCLPSTSEWHDAGVSCNLIGAPFAFVRPRPRVRCQTLSVLKDMGTSIPHRHAITTIVHTCTCIIHQEDPSFAFLLLLVLLLLFSITKSKN